MLYYGIVFFVISVVAGLLGFRGVESGASEIAKLFLFIFFVLAVVISVGVMLGVKMVV